MEHLRGIVQSHDHTRNVTRKGSGIISAKQQSHPAYIAHREQSHTEEHERIRCITRGP